MSVKIYFSMEEYEYLISNVNDIDVFIDEIQNCKNTGRFIKIIGKFGHTHYVNPDKILYVSEV